MLDAGGQWSRGHWYNTYGGNATIEFMDDVGYDAMVGRTIKEHVLLSGILWRLSLFLLNISLICFGMGEKCLQMVKQITHADTKRNRLYDNKFSGYHKFLGYPSFCSALTVTYAVKT